MRLSSQVLYLETVILSQYFFLEYHSILVKKLTQNTHITFNSVKHVFTNCTALIYFVILGTPSSPPKRKYICYKYWVTGMILIRPKFRYFPNSHIHIFWIMVLRAEGTYVWRLTVFVFCFGNIHSLFWWSGRVFCF